MRRFRLLEPHSLDEACALLQQEPQARPIAGGTALLVLMKLAIYLPETLVNLKKVRDASTVTFDAERGLRIGALATIYEVESHPAVRRHYPMLASACHDVANIRIRNMATLGGNLAHADYQSDPPTALLALEASLELASVREIREVPLGEFILGPYETALEPGELVSAVLMPPPRPGTRATYLKFTTHSSEDRPCVGIAVVAHMRGERCEDLRLVVGAVSPTPTRVRAAEAAARGERLTPATIEELAVAAAEAVEPIPDMLGAADYKRRVVRVLARRALGGVALEARP